MRWARVAVAVGLLLLAVGFHLATDTPVSAVVDGRSVRCADVLAPADLLSGQPEVPRSAPPARDGDGAAAARVRAACEPREQVARAVVWGGLALGGLLLLVGWTALRELGSSGPRSGPHPGPTAEPLTPAGGRAGRPGATAPR